MTAKRRTRKTKAVTGPSKVLVLRTCDKNMQGHGGFQWPESGPVSAPDWDPNPDIECGKGLHGLAWGDGDWSYLSNLPDAKWLVVEVDAEDVVPSINKVRFRSGTVIYCGSEVEAVARVMCCAENFDRISLLSKGKSKASGDSSTAASSGNSSTAASSGDYSTAASSGNSSTAASSGDYSKAASSGDSGIAASIGHGGRAKAGQNGLVIVCWWDAGNERHRACVGEVGIDGVKADTWYCVRDGKLSEVSL